MYHKGLLKGTDSVKSNEIQNTLAAVFQSVYEKFVFESCKNVAVSITIFCLEVCVCDIMNKIDMLEAVCQLNYVISQPFLLLCIGKGQTSMAAPWGGKM